MSSAFCEHRPSVVDGIALRDDFAFFPSLAVGAVEMWKSAFLLCCGFPSAVENVEKSWASNSATFASPLFHVFHRVSFPPRLGRAGRVHALAAVFETQVPGRGWCSAVPSCRLQRRFQSSLQVHSGGRPEASSCCSGVVPYHGAGLVSPGLPRAYDSVSSPVLRPQRSSW